MAWLRELVAPSLLLSEYISMNKAQNWLRIIKKIVKIYLIIGLVISTFQNIMGLIYHEPSAFCWTRSISIIDNLTLLFWWFVLPIFIWPIDLFWALYHKF